MSCMQGKMDLFCKVSLGREAFRTKAHENGGFCLSCISLSRVHSLPCAWSSSLYVMRVRPCASVESVFELCFAQRADERARRI
jgi:hypothetical protein